MRITLHARIEIGIIAALLLGSCDGPGLSQKQRDQVADIAGDEVGDAVADDDTVSELDDRVTAIEQRLNM